MALQDRLSNSIQTGETLKEIKYIEDSIGEQRKLLKDMLSVGETFSGRMSAFDDRLSRLKCRIRDLEGVQRRQRWESVRPLIRNEEMADMSRVAFELDKVVRFEDLLDETLHDFSTRHLVGSLKLELGHGLNNDKLLPYWKELARVMQSSQYQQALSETKFRLARTCDISSSSLSKTVMDVLRPAFRLNCFKSVSFIHNQFGHEGIEFVLDVIEVNPHLQVFHLHNST